MKWERERSIQNCCFVERGVRGSNIFPESRLGISSTTPISGHGSWSLHTVALFATEHVTRTHVGRLWLENRQDLTLLTFAREQEQELSLKGTVDNWRRHLLCKIPSHTQPIQWWIGLMKHSRAERGLKAKKRERSLLMFSLGTTLFDWKPFLFFLPRRTLMPLEILVITHCLQTRKT